MDQIRHGTIIAFMFVASIFIYTLMGTFFGGVIGGIVGVFFTNTIMGTLYRFGIDTVGLTMWQLGATLGFVSSFFKAAMIGGVSK